MNAESEIEKNKHFFTFFQLFYFEKFRYYNILICTRKYFYQKSFKKDT